MPAPVMMGFGSVFVIIGSVWLIVAAFRKAPAWGIACIVFPPTAIAFLIAHRVAAWRPFLMFIVGLMITLTGKGMLPPPAPGPSENLDGSGVEQTTQEDAHVISGHSFHGGHFHLKAL